MRFAIFNGRRRIIKQSADIIFLNTTANTLTGQMPSIVSSYSLLHREMLSKFLTLIVIWDIILGFGGERM